MSLPINVVATKCSTDLISSFLAQKNPEGGVNVECADHQTGHIQHDGE